MATNLGNYGGNKSPLMTTHSVASQCASEPSIKATPAGVTIRELNGHDLERGFLDVLSGLASVELTLEQAREVLRQRLRRDVHTYVACRDERVVGTAALLVEHKFIHGGSRCGHLEDVVVDREYQGTGIATALVRHVIREAQRFGCYKVILSCYESLVPFYERTGFHVQDVGMRMDLPHQEAKDSTIDGRWAGLE